MIPRSSLLRHATLVACMWAAVLAGRPWAAGQDLPAPMAMPAQAPDPPPPPSFDDFLAGVRAEAMTRGISQDTLDRTLAGLSPEPVVVARDRAQPELTQSLEAYVASRLTPRVLATGREMLGTHRDLLARVSTAYGVPPPVLVAVWGLESNFGHFTGSYATIRSLATLAFDARRPLFRSELFEALAIIDRGQIQPDEMKGSWAGAMGQPQFMPSSFRKHAVDFDGDGRPNIWTSVPDVLASMASFLKAAGWTHGERWGREVSVPRAVMTAVEREVPMRTTGCRALRETTIAQPIETWRALGVQTAGGGALPDSTMTAALVRGRRRSFLVYRNYEAILDYNCSNAYAVTVGLLADRISAR